MTQAKAEQESNPIDKFELLKLILDLAEKESDRAWTRYSMMLYVNTGILAILSLTLNSSLFAVNAVPSVMGVAISLAWLRINKLSYFYSHRWYTDAEEIVKSDPVLTEWMRGRNRPRIDRPFRPRASSSTYSNIVPLSFLVLWTVILVVVILAGVWPAFAEALATFGKAATPK